MGEARLQPAVLSNLREPSAFSALKCSWDFPNGEIPLAFALSWPTIILKPALLGEMTENSQLINHK